MSSSKSTALPSRRDILRLGVAGAGTLATAWATAGCTPGAAARADPMQFWQMYAPAPQQDPNLVAQSQWFLDATKRWADAGKRPVDMVYIPAYTDPTNTRLTTAFASGEGPDIFLISPGDFLRYYNGGVLTDLTPYMTQEAIDDFYPQALATRTVDGKIYGLPMEHIDALADLGVTSVDMPATPQSLWRLLQEHRQPIAAE